MREIQCEAVIGDGADCAFDEQNPRAVDHRPLDHRRFQIRAAPGVRAYADAGRLHGGQRVQAALGAPQGLGRQQLAARAVDEIVNGAIWRAHEPLEPDEIETRLGNFVPGPERSVCLSGEEAARGREVPGQTIVGVAGRRLLRQLRRLGPALAPELEARHLPQGGRGLGTQLRGRGQAVFGTLHVPRRCEIQDGSNEPAARRIGRGRGGSALRVDLGGARRRCGGLGRHHEQRPSPRSVPPVHPLSFFQDAERPEGGIVQQHAAVGPREQDDIVEAPAGRAGQRDQGTAFREVLDGAVGIGSMGKGAVASLLRELSKVVRGDSVAARFERAREILGPHSRLAPGAEDHRQGRSPAERRRLGKEGDVGDVEDERRRLRFPLGGRRLDRDPQGKQECRESTPLALHAKRPQERIRGAGLTE